MTQFLAFWFGLIVAAIITPLVINWYRRHHWLDDPQEQPHRKKTHRQPVPRGGGWPILGAFLFGSLIFFPLDTHLLAIITAALLLTLVGWLDDIYDLHPLIRMGTGMIAALIVIGSGLGIAFVSNPFGPGTLSLAQPQWQFTLAGQTHSIWILADLFALFFIIWNMNIVNWSKGVDGQLPAFVMVAFIFIGLLSDTFSADPTEFNNATLSFLLAGAYGGLLIFNWYPQKILPGYGAGSLAGFFLSLLAIISGAKVATSLMVLAIPTADGIYTICRRLRRGKSPFWGDRGHLHHRLLDYLGWGRRKIALFYATSSLIMGGLALILNTQGKVIALGVSFIIVFGLQIYTKMVQSKSASHV